MVAEGQTGHDTLTCYGCKHHMGCTKTAHGFLGCRCRKHDNPIVLTRYVHMEKRACAVSTWHYATDACPDWEPASRRPRFPYGTRESVAAMHGTECYFCHKLINLTTDGDGVVLHHVIWHKDGGAIHPENLRLAHRACHDEFHRSKGC